MKLTWDSIRTNLNEYQLPPHLERLLRWVERHPQAVLAGALIVLMALALAQTPSESAEADTYNGETPLFV